MNAGRLIARAAIGGLFVGHGTQKLFGWFGGPGLDGTTRMMEGLELHPPKRQALAASLAETVGGAMVVLGAATPLAGAVLSGSMFTAIRKVHADKGHRTGSRWALASVAAGAAGSALAIEAGRRFEPEPTGRFKREPVEAGQDERVSTSA